MVLPRAMKQKGHVELSWIEEMGEWGLNIYNDPVAGAIRVSQSCEEGTQFRATCRQFSLDPGVMADGGCRLCALVVSLGH